MTEWVTGAVIRRLYGAGSKSERHAVMIRTAKGDLTLVRLGGNPFADPILEALVGKTIAGKGERTSVSFILEQWNEIDPEAGG